MPLDARKAVSASLISGVYRSHPSSYGNARERKAECNGRLHSQGEMRYQHIRGVLTLTDMPSLTHLAGDSLIFS